MARFNRICAPSTLSTHRLKMTTKLSGLFQSHLRPIHPIHLPIIWGLTPEKKVSIASAPHPPYPQWQESLQDTLKAVSIASAPHPPYPPDMTFKVLTALDSFNRICAPSTLSTINLSVQEVKRFLFQSHLRPIHPIHISPTSG